jgi:hypothetical protein
MDEIYSIKNSDIGTRSALSGSFGYAENFIEYNLGEVASRTDLIVGQSIKPVTFGGLPKSVQIIAHTRHGLSTLSTDNESPLPQPIWVYWQRHPALQFDDFHRVHVTPTTTATIGEVLLLWYDVQLPAAMRYGVRFFGGVNYARLVGRFE